MKRRTHSQPRHQADEPKEHQLNLRLGRHLLDAGLKVGPVAVKGATLTLTSIFFLVSLSIIVCLVLVNSAKLTFQLQGDTDKIAFRRKRVFCTFYFQYIYFFNQVY